MAARRRVRFSLFALGTLSMVAGLLFTVGTAASPATAATCAPRLLVLSAMPLEMDPLLAHATLDGSPPVVLNNRYFVTGTLDGNAVIMGLTGIGPENAQTTTAEAFEHYRCNGTSEISGVVFSGTSGGDYVGDVFVPQNWSYDGQPAVPTNPAMYSVARQVNVAALPLEQTTPSGDPACVCALSSGIGTPVTVTHVPTVEFGGSGLTTDPFGGRTLPCAPAGSDIFGCVPCREMDQSQLEQAEAFAQGAPAFLQPSFFTNFIESTTPAGNWVTEDNETAVVAQVAAHYEVPFIGFRAASDGPGNNPGTGGDPLMLPGFPAQFAIYRQLAADNAATTAMAFLTLWSTEG